MTGLSLRSVRVQLNGRQILHNVSFAVAPGEIVGLIGPNGAGKTTALKAALGLVPISEGIIWLNDAPAEDTDRRVRARTMAYVPQGAPVFWPMSAERTVALGRIPHLSPWQNLDTDDLECIKASMRATDCWHLRERLVTSLSGGERSRVLLARAIAVGAKYLLADEPTEALDPAHQLQVMDILREQASKGVGSLVVMHDLSLAARACDRLVLMKDGTVLASGDTEKVLTDEYISLAFGIRVARWDEEGVQVIAPLKRTEK